MITWDSPIDHPPSENVADAEEPAASGELEPMLGDQVGCVASALPSTETLEAVIATDPLFLIVSETTAPPAEVA